MSDNQFEFAFNLLGIEGRMTRRPYTERGKRGKLTFMHQIFKASRMYREDGASKKIIISVRFDDNCRNGHNSFSITGEIWSSLVRGDCETCGCIHEEIAKHFPEVAHLIKWHLVSTDGPMHYPGNALYHASNRDHNGKLKGEPWAWDDVAYMGNSPFPVKISNSKFLAWMKARIEFLVSTPKSNPAWHPFEVEAIHHERNDEPGTHKYSDNYTLVGFEARWATCPFSDPLTAEAWATALDAHVDSLRKPNGSAYIRFDKIPTLFSEGKKRELDHARSSAIWPEATDEQLCLPKEELKALLDARLPALMVECKRDIEAAGFMWEVE